VAGTGGDNTWGNAVFVDIFMKREKTVGPEETLDSELPGAPGGWVDP